MRVLYLTHSLRSCWNHGNAHFVRGVMRSLRKLGHAIDIMEPSKGWSLQNLRADGGADAEDAYRSVFNELPSRFYDSPDEVLEAAESADVVIVHEWTDASVVQALGRRRATGGQFLLLFHDTHHRAASDPASLDRAALEDYDFILAFGESLSEIYRDWGFEAHSWHEAADVSHFYPRIGTDRKGAIWIGNWGDGERTEELEEFLFKPIEEAEIPLAVHGVRYPAEALARLEQIGAIYGGWIPNIDVPTAFSRHRFTVHVPRRLYTTLLPGIPTIRPFEAMACGIPLVSAWWPDEEGLFVAGEDYLVARSGDEMRRHMRDLVNDNALCASLAKSGLKRIRERHTCGHRAAELLNLIQRKRATQQSQARLTEELGA
jgi:spore maturation protein CgeB